MTAAPWAVVLAGGDGDRVSAITRDAEGRVVPKQFWCCEGQPPMVKWALARARAVAPPSHILAVVREQHSAYWPCAFADLPRRNILVQPENRGTAAGVMRALVEIQSREFTTVPVVLLPSDHYVEDERVLRDALGVAIGHACHGDPPVVLLGISPTAQETGYGWIVPESSGALARVRQFVEKPPAPRVRELVRNGALINSFILAARAHVLLALIARVFPDNLRAFQRTAREPEGAPVVRGLYEALPSMDLSHDVLERSTAFLSVVRVPPCGWSDLGTLERLQRFLDHAPWNPEPRPPGPRFAAA
ncbi:MAG: sugar phosphate nucleotidyltransferase [Vicinamibacterales bacterium]